MVEKRKWTEKQAAVSEKLIQNIFTAMGKNINLSLEINTNVTQRGNAVSIKEEITRLNAVPEFILIANKLSDT